MSFLDAYLERRALAFANTIRDELALPPTKRMERGMLRRSSECPITRTIGPNVWTCPHALIIGGARCGDFLIAGAKRDLPLAVQWFVRRFDKGKFPHLRTLRPLDRGIDHLDFPVEDEQLIA